MTAAENRPRHDPHVPGEIMADDQRGWQPGRWLWQAGTQPAVGPRPAVVNLPDAKRLLQNNDGYGFFAAVDGLVKTGPTLTNVNDFRAILVLPS